MISIEFNQSAVIACPPSVCEFWRMIKFALHNCFRITLHYIIVLELVPSCFLMQDWKLYSSKVCFAESLRTFHGKFANICKTRLAKGFCRAKFWVKFPFWRGSVRGEVFAKFAAKFSTKFLGLFCWDIQTKKIFSENFSPKFPWVCTAKLAKFQWKTSWRGSAGWASPKTRFIVSGKSAGIPRKVCGHFAENFRQISAKTPSRTPFFLKPLRFYILRLF